MIKAKSLVKSFGNFKAVDGLDLEVREGECFGLLGPNGAGKSTFIGMAYGMVQRTSGELTVFGLDPRSASREIKKHLGVVTQENALDESLTVLENMRLYAAFGGIPSSERASRISELLEYMNLAHKRDAKIQELSGGMKRRLVFVRALLARPKLLILDEPTTGLDPAVRHLLWGKVRELRSNGTTILLTTHYMHEAEVLCDRLVIMNQGKAVSEGAPPKMIREHVPGFVGVFGLDEKDRARTLVERAPSEFHFHEDASSFTLRASTMAALTSAVGEIGLTPLQLRPANLEDVFLKLTGRELSVDA